MQSSFETLIDTYLENEIGQVDDFLSEVLASELKINLLALYEGSKLQDAGTGNREHLLHDKKMRSDKIFWLDRAHEDQSENKFFDLMDQFVNYLNSTCYTGITGYEFHYTMYEAGSFYKKHIDQFQSDPRRAFSMIMYLNADWKESDGGELCIFKTGGTQLITPENGKSVFFKSSALAHEVLVTNVPRLSITGWLKTD